MKRVLTILLIAGAVPAAGVATAVALSPTVAEVSPVAEIVELTGMREGRGWHRGRGHRRGAMMGILREADANGDRELTQVEVDTFVSEKVSVGDANGDGDLTLEEFQAVWADLTRQPMVRAFQRLDRDGDATITEAELNERFGSIVARLDRNDDGVLSRDDRRGRGWHRDRRDDDDDDDDN